LVCFIIPYTKTDQLFTVDSHNKMLILLFVGKLTGLGFRDMKVFFYGTHWLLLEREGLNDIFIFFFAQCDYLIAIERKKIYNLGQWIF